MPMGAVGDGIFANFLGMINIEYLADVASKAGQNVAAVQNVVFAERPNAMTVSVHVHFPRIGVGSPHKARAVT